MTDQEVRRLMRLAACSERVLADGEFKEVLVDMKQTAIRAWAETKPEDSAGRERAWNDLQAVGRLENLLKDYAARLRLQDVKDGRGS